MALRRTQLIAVAGAVAAVVVVAGVALAIARPRIGGSGREVSLTVEASTPAAPVTSAAPATSAASAAADRPGADRPGAAPSAGDLDRTRQLLIARMRSAGFDRPKVDRSGNRRLVLHAKAGAGAPPLRDLIAPGQLRIRRVLATSDPNAGAATTPAGPTANGPTANGPTANGPTSGGPTNQGPTDNGPTDNGPASIAPTDNGPADPTASGQPQDLPTGPRATVAAKLGPAYGAADQVTSFAEGQALAPNVLPAFAALTPDEVAVLPEQMQLYVPTISCDVLHDRPPGAITQPDTAIVACNGDGQKYLLDEASVTGRDVRAAKAVNHQGLWSVTVELTADGQQRFTAVTSDIAADQTNQSDHGQLAIVVDATIVSAPTVLAAIPGDLEIAGAFTPDEAKLLAAQLSGGELPLILKPTS